MIIAAAILLLIAVAINYFNNLRDARNGHINHTRAWKIKAITCLPSLVLFAWGHGWMGIAASIFLTGSWFMLLFNGAWGLKVANDFFYRSTAVGKNLPWSDRIFLHWPKWIYILFMLALCVVSTFLYVKSVR